MRVAISNYLAPGRTTTGQMDVLLEIKLFPWRGGEKGNTRVSVVLGTGGSTLGFQSPLRIPTYLGTHT